MLRYLRSLSPGTMVLWCYLIWYLVTVFFYFDPSLSLWLNSLGISAVIGVALLLSVNGPASGRRDPWQVFRLFLMPFCVSSFSSLIKGQGYLLMLPPTLSVRAASVGGCAIFALAVVLLKRFSPARQ